MGGIEVDVDGLAEFRAFIARELDQSLRPVVGTIQDSYAVGVIFGVHNAGVNILAARSTYQAALERSGQNLAQYVAVADALISAITTVSQRYQDTDATAESVLSEIGTLLSDQAQVAAFQAAAEAGREDRVRGQSLA